MVRHFIRFFTKILFCFSYHIVKLAFKSIIYRTDFIQSVQDEIHNVNEESSSSAIVTEESPPPSTEPSSSTKKSSTNNGKNKKKNSKKEKSTQ